MWLRMGQLMVVHPNRQVIGWAGAGYFPAPLSSHVGGVHEVMTRAANASVILEEANVSNEELVTV